MRRTFVLVALASFMSVPAFGAALTEKPIYAGILGGASILTDSDNRDTSSSFSMKSEADTGFAAGAFVGYRFKNGIRVEGEGTYRRNDLNKLTVTNDAGLGAAVGIGSLNGLTVDASGDVSALTFMANMWFEPEVGGGLLPYAGGGIGFAHISVDASALGAKLVDDSDNVLAGQVGVGVGYAIMPSVVLSVDYRFLITADPTFTDKAGGSFDSEYMAHNVMVGVRTHF